MYKTITNECTFLFIQVRSEVFAVRLRKSKGGILIIFSRLQLFFRFVYRLPDKRRYRIKCYKSTMNAIEYASREGIFRVRFGALNKAA